MSAHRVAQFVRDPFRAQWDERIAKGHAMSLLQVAREFGVSRSAVYRAANDGRLPAFRVGSIFRIRPEAIPLELVAAWNALANERADLPTGSLVYFLGGPDGFVKIGFTANLQERVKDLQVGCPVPIRLLAYVAGDVALERQYHGRFCAHRQSGEWFALVPEIQAEIDRLSMTSRESA